MTATDYISRTTNFMVPQAQPWAETLIGLSIILAASLIVNLIFKKIILRIIVRLLSHESPILPRIAARLANIFPAIVISAGIVLVPHLPLMVVDLIRNIVSAFIILTIVLALSGGLNFINEIYNRRDDSANKPIKGYIQVIKIVLFAAAAILIVAVIIGQSPLLLLSGLGAMAAVLLLVFKDTILSLVASVQLQSNDMLRVGDWIEMPQLNADGDVIDIALHTVKVQNWDRTITTIPTHRLIEESFRNWRGMADSGGRRIKRSLLIDETSICFLTPEKLESMRRFALLGPYLDKKQAELEEWNAKALEGGRDPVNARRVTNIGTFRAYVIEYLRAHPQIAQHMTMLVRQLDPSPKGLPLEIYCFTSTTNWNAYEGIQSDIFDHMLAVLPEFGLRHFQEPSGADFKKLAGDGCAS